VLQIADKIGLPGLHIHEAVDEEAVEGTGNLIWAAGIRLSQHLVRNRAGELKGARVLDLGAGTGGGEQSVVYSGPFESVLSDGLISLMFQPTSLLCCAS